MDAEKVRHDMRRIEGKDYRCLRCGGRWSVKQPASSCPGIALYRQAAGDLIPEGMATEAGLRERKLRLPPGVDPIAFYETRYHQRHPLYPVIAARPVRPLSEKQRLALEAGRKLRNRCVCGDAGEIFRNPTAAIDTRNRPRFHALLREAVPFAEEVPVLCRRCYAREWKREERSRMEEAARAFHRMLLEAPACILDFETTGLVAPAVVEVGVLLLGTSQRFEAIVRPWKPVEAEAQAIHNIPPSDVASADPWPVVAGRLLQWLDTLGTSRRPVLYSWGSFETLTLQSERAHWMGQGRPDPFPGMGEVVNLRPVYKALRERAVLYEGEPEPRMAARLADACEAYGLPGGTHRAMADVLATAGLVEAMLERPPYTRPGTDLWAYRR